MWRIPFFELSKTAYSAALFGTKHRLGSFPGLVGSVFTLELSDEFRNNARNCLRFSQEANSLEAQGYWIAMAQLWFDLATNAEERKTINH
jgi:hypothetical protein